MGDNTRDSVNTGLADYTPIFLSQIPQLFRNKMIPIDVALIQTSLPDQNGYVSLGISVDICMAAIENASLIIAQMNPRMPRVHGDTFLQHRRTSTISSTMTRSFWNTTPRSRTRSPSRSASMSPAS